MWKAQLERYFGPDPDEFTDERIAAMKTYVQTSLEVESERFEYTSIVGLAKLFDTVAGHVTPAMASALEDYSRKIGQREAALLGEAKAVFAAVAGKRS